MSKKYSIDVKLNPITRRPYRDFQADRYRFIEYEFPANFKDLFSLNIELAKLDLLTLQKLLKAIENKPKAPMKSLH